MIHPMRLLLSLILLLPIAVGAVDPLEFRSDAERQRFNELAEELRCLVCQNQSIADSNAPLAKDLRREVLGLMREGKSDAEIRDHLVARYSEFVLYRPRVNASTLVLWISPAIVLLIGFLIVWRVVRRSQQSSQEAEP